MRQDNIPTPRMYCDYTGFCCLGEVRRAPIIVIPAREMLRPDFKALRIPTPLHYCEAHRGDFDVQAYLSDAQKSRIEDALRSCRPADFKADFDGAFADLVLVTTPEYRRFLVHIGAIRRRANVA